MGAGDGGSRLLEGPGDVGRASRDRRGRRDVVDGPGFLPAEEGRFFLDLRSQTSVASRGTEVFQFPSLRVQGGHGEAGGKSRWGRRRGSPGGLTACCISGLHSPPPPVHSALGVCGLPIHWLRPPSLSPSAGSRGALSRSPNTEAGGSIREGLGLGAGSPCAQAVGSEASWWGLR